MSKPYTKPYHYSILCIDVLCIIVIKIFNFLQKLWLHKISEKINANAKRLRKFQNQHAAQKSKQSSRLIMYLECLPPYLLKRKQVLLLRLFKIAIYCRAKETGKVSMFSCLMCMHCGYGTFAYLSSFFDDTWLEFFVKFVLHYLLFCDCLSDLKFLCPSLIFVSNTWICLTFGRFGTIPHMMVFVILCLQSGA